MVPEDDLNSLLPSTPLQTARTPSAAAGLAAAGLAAAVLADAEQLQQQQQQQQQQLQQLQQQQQQQLQQQTNMPPAKKTPAKKSAKKPTKSDATKKKKKKRTESYSSYIYYTPPRAISPNAHLCQPVQFCLHAITTYNISSDDGHSALPSSVPISDVYPTFRPLRRGFNAHPISDGVHALLTSSGMN